MEPIILEFTLAKKLFTTRVGCFLTPSPQKDLFLSLLDREHWQVVNIQQLNLREEAIEQSFREQFPPDQLLPAIKVVGVLYMQGVLTAINNYEKIFLQKYDDITIADFPTDVDEILALYETLLDQNSGIGR